MRKGVTRRKFRPVIDAKIVGLKKRPRGKSFAPGNTHGLATRFKPGESGNPAGRPRTKKLSEAIREGLAADSAEPLPTDTNAQIIAKQIIRQAKKGNLSAAVIAGDRAEGRPAQSVAFSDERDALVELVFPLMNELSAEAGRPEGMEDSVPSLPEGNEQIETQEEIQP